MEQLQYSKLRIMFDQVQISEWYQLDKKYNLSDDYEKIVTNLDQAWNYYWSLKAISFYDSQINYDKVLIKILVVGVLNKSEVLKNETMNPISKIIQLCVKKLMKHNNDIDFIPMSSVLLNDYSNQQLKDFKILLILKNLLSQQALSEFQDIYEQDLTFNQEFDLKREDDSYFILILFLQIASPWFQKHNCDSRQYIKFHDIYLQILQIWRGTEYLNEAMIEVLRLNIQLSFPIFLKERLNHEITLFQKMIYIIESNMDSLVNDLFCKNQDIISYFCEYMNQLFQSCSHKYLKDQGIDIVRIYCMFQNCLMIITQKSIQNVQIEIKVFLKKISTLTEYILIFDQDFLSMVNIQNIYFFLYGEHYYSKTQVQDNNLESLLLQCFCKQLDGQKLLQLIEILVEQINWQKEIINFLCLNCLKNTMEYNKDMKQIFEIDSNKITNLNFLQLILALQNSRIDLNIFSQISQNIFKNFKYEYEIQYDFIIIFLKSNRLNYEDSNTYMEKYYYLQEIFLSMIIQNISDTKNLKNMIEKNSKDVSKLIFKFIETIHLIIVFLTQSLIEHENVAFLKFRQFFCDNCYKLLPFSFEANNSYCKFCNTLIRAINLSIHSNSKQQFNVNTAMHYKQKFKQYLKKSIDLQKEICQSQGSDKIIGFYYENSDFVVLFALKQINHILHTLN